MEEEKTKYCPHCGTMIPYMESYCPLCGKPQPNLQEMEKVVPKKNPWIAFVLSLLITGLGQLYNRRYGRALAFFGITILIGGVLSLYYSTERIMIFGVIMALISALDAYRISNELNKS
jgi:TM2 domain-containing membrane protein YozV